ncbi:chitin synthase-domain-containing protein [Gaertneriomyces semiglobifer]|nr:chitin synthase-domain-containing protein [Gaertneriomyces semiglobifer]
MAPGDGSPKSVAAPALEIDTTATEPSEQVNGETVLEVAPTPVVEQNHWDDRDTTQAAESNVLKIDTIRKGDKDIEVGLTPLSPVRRPGKEVKVDEAVQERHEPEEDKEKPKVAPDAKKKKGWFSKKNKTAPSKDEKVKKSKVPLTRARRNWVCFTWAMTWWIPSWCLRKCGGMSAKEVQMAWREKFALCTIIAFLCAVMLFFVQFFSKILCPSADIFAVAELASYNKLESGKGLFAAWNGYVYDVKGYVDKHPDPAYTILPLAGKDVSPWFPRISSTYGLHESCPQPDQLPPIPKCAARGYSTAHCHDTVNIERSINIFKDIPVFKVGKLAYPRDAVYSHAKDEDAWILINGRYYDVTDILEETNPISQAFPTSYKVLLKYYRGKDASSVYDRLQPYLECLENQFFVGAVDDRISSAACHASEYILLGCTGIMVGILVIKFLAALQLGSKRQPEHHDRFVIMQVPCYTEGEDSLRKTIDSLALLSYDDTRKLLFIVADGLVQGAGNPLPTPDIVLHLLGVDTKAPGYKPPQPQSYVAVGEGSKQHNRAQVYSGLYYIQARAVPFIVVVKCGTETEKVKPGNRGKRDSQMILMKFLNKVHYSAPMTPLDLEMFHHMKDIIGVDPYLYEYVLMVDADTEVIPDSLNRLVACCIHDAKIMGICGETKIANEKQSWVTMMQVYEYYISHHMAKAFESLFGSVTCLPGCFSMYRVRTPTKKIPLLISSDIIHEYEETNVDTLHKKNLLSLGEDRFLTTLMLKYFPEYRTKFTPDAKCLTIVPDQMNVLLSQRRRWINSTIHNLFELLFLPQLCGCMIFSMRFVVFLDLFATLIMPASTAYLFYLIYQSVEAKEAPILSLIMIAAAYGLQAIIFIIKREYQHVGWMIINILAMPVFSIWLPLYSYWHFDDFSWGNTRKTAGGKVEAAGHVNDGEVFDVSVVPLKKWDEYAKENMTGGQWDADKNFHEDGDIQKSVHADDLASEYGGSVYSEYPAPSQYSYAHAHTRPVSMVSYNRTDSRPTSMHMGGPVRPSRPVSTMYVSQPPQMAFNIGAPAGRQSTDALLENPESSPTSSDDISPSAANGGGLRRFPSDMALNTLAETGYSGVQQPPAAFPVSRPVSMFAPGLPTDGQMLHQIRHIIQSSDLGQLTKRTIREELVRLFGCDKNWIEERKDVIGGWVEAILRGEM